MDLNNTICVIRSSQNENEVFNLEQNGMITLKHFTGEDNQLFYILKKMIMIINIQLFHIKVKNIWEIAITLI